MIFRKWERWGDFSLYSKATWHNLCTYCLLLTIFSDPDQPQHMEAWSLNPAAVHEKSKRVRTIFTSEQLQRLEKVFEEQQYMVGTERLVLASELQLSEAQVSPGDYHNKAELLAQFTLLFGDGGGGRWNRVREHMGIYATPVLWKTWNISPVHKLERLSSFN